MDWQLHHMLVVGPSCTSEGLLLALLQANAEKMQDKEESVQNVLPE
jgi:hypothetical protein